eukprot:GHVR01097683.1.p3 GENE.GHVR01097683.1~~GHVR01097683.1.p3  ORF type:complete len:106 (-),score=9.21 GHVR01097683.1:818-1135(-)
MTNLSSVVLGSGFVAGIPGSVPLRRRYVMTMPWAAQKTENSNDTGMKAGKFSRKEKLGFPPIFIGQSDIMVYHIKKTANDKPVMAYMKDVIANRVRLIPITGSIP